MCQKDFCNYFHFDCLTISYFCFYITYEKLAAIIYISHFFDIMLPVLAVGALIKYLCTHR